MYTVYRFYDAAGVLLYVGCTGKSIRRWMEHARYQPWWSQVVSVTLTHYPSAEEAFAAEAGAIRSEGPLHNVMHGPKNREAHTGHQYRRWGEGSIYQQKRNGSWNASIWHNGKRHRFYGGPGDDGKARAARLLEDFRRENGIVAKERKWDAA